MNKNKSIHSQLVSYNIGIPKEFKKSVNYILCKKGAREIRETELGRFIVIPKNVVGLESLEEGFTMKLPKIPFDLLLQSISFFKRVYELHKTESILQIYWNRVDKSYFIYCPEQVVSSASVDFKRNTSLDKKHLPVLEIHSHGSMGAFFSGTDDADEKATRLYAVVGKLNDVFPDILLRASCGGVSIPLDLEDVFDMNANIPEEWLKQISIQERTTINGLQSSLFSEHSELIDEDELFAQREYYKPGFIERMAREERLEV